MNKQLAVSVCECVCRLCLQAFCPSLPHTTPRSQKSVAHWDESRARLSRVGAAFVDVQSSIATALAGEVTRATRAHNRIANAPQDAKDAKRLLRMRIEKNFERLVRRWMDTRTGWAIVRWKAFVLRHRKYQAWVDEMTPHVVRIQLMYRGWR